MQVRRTLEFTEWLKNLRDRSAKAKILARIDRLEDGNVGQSRSIGGGIVELKIDFGPGYRVYYVQRGSTLILLLCGGDKDSQKDDTRLARRLASEFKE